MAKSQVTAYVIDTDLEGEQRDGRARQLALDLMGASAHATNSFIHGELEDADIPRLEQAGLLVVRQEAARRPTPAAGFQPRALSARFFGLAPAASLEAFADEEGVPAEVDYYTLRLRGPMFEEWQQRLTAAGAQIVEGTATGGLKVRLKIEDVGKVRALVDIVESLDWIPPARSAPKVRTESVIPAVGAPPAGLKMLTFDVRLHVPEDRPEVEEWIRQHGLAISGSSGRKIRFFALENATVIDDLAALPAVDRIAEYIEPSLSNDVARVILAVDAAPGQNPQAIIAQEGDGELVAVADTGIDDTHPDFQGRIAGKVARGRPGDTTDPNGHGTHVAGSVLGDGAASGGQIRGIAPKAKLYFQSLLDANGRLGGLPLDLNDLFGEAYQAGARIHNNSWGADALSSYTLNSEEVDEFVHSHPDMLIVIAAGNAGNSAKPRNAAVGFVDWLSINSPASSKNALTVGASRTSRPDGALGATTWSAGFGAQFPDPPIAQEPISGDPNCLAAFSSRGPCDDFRIKPDLVAPGTDIASTLSSLAPIGNFWGPYPPSATVPAARYAYDGGTSMATPLVSGCAALVREYYVKIRQHQPSAALLKATLINSTVWLTGADSGAPKAGTPNYHQGHGRVAMDRAIPNASRAGLQLQFVDDWAAAAAGLSRTGERRRYQFAPPAVVPELRICLAYTDPPARGLQNNVNLIVQHLPTGQRWTGNSALPDGITPLDTTNNVEKILIPNAPAGNYVILIVASNLLKPPQDFALVVTGDQVPALTQI